ncbi:unnamed protein product, partial [Phaeothamnion confervicola]
SILSQLDEPANNDNDVMEQNKDPRAAAQKYIEEKKIDELFQELSTRIIYDRPAEPTTYLIDLLQGMVAAREGGGKAAGFFDEDDISALFSMLDPNKSGSVSQKQYEQVLTSLGVIKMKGAAETGRLDKARFQAAM